MPKLFLSFSSSLPAKFSENRGDLIVDFSGSLPSNSKVVKAWDVMRHSHQLASVAERLCKQKNLPLDYVVAKIYLHEVKKQPCFSGFKTSFNMAPPLLAAASKSYVAYLILKVFWLLYEGLITPKTPSPKYARVGNSEYVSFDKRLNLPNLQFTAKPAGEVAEIWGGMHSEKGANKFAALIQDGFLPSNNALIAEKFKLAGRELIVRSLLDETLAKNVGIRTRIDSRFFLSLPSMLAPTKADFSSVLVALNHVGFWSPEIYLGSTWDVLRWGAEYARLNPSLVVTLRMHPTHNSWFHEGKSAEREYLTYIEKLKLDNLKISSSKTRSLGEDFMASDFVISEYSDVCLQAISAGKPAAYLSFPPKRDLSEAYFNLEFPKIMANDFYISHHSVSKSLNSFLANWQKTVDSVHMDISEDI